MIALLLWAFIFACAATIGLVAAYLLCARVEAAEDGPRAIVLHPAIPIVVFAIFGAILALHGATPSVLGLVAILGIPLVGSWQSDALKGIVPDALTLGSLAVIAVAVVWNRTWWVAASALVIFAAFALAAYFSKGRGMGWGDAKLAALCGAVLGLQGALLTLSLACFVATGVSVLRDRGTKPIAFAPYMVGAVLVALLVTVHA